MIDGQRFAQDIAQAEEQVHPSAGHLLPEEDPRWVSIAIDPGEPVRLQEVHVEVQGPGGSDPLFTRLLAAPALRRGEPLRHAAYEQLKSDLQGTAITYGYLDARLLRSELQVDPEAHTAAVQLVLESGPRYHFGATTIEQAAIGPGLARRYLRYAEGEPYDAGTVTDQDMAMAKLKATEMLAFVADEAIQIHGGMGLMDDLPLERIWRDARVERIWEGTSEIQRHIISRALLRAVGG